MSESVSSDSSKNNEVTFTRSPENKRRLPSRDAKAQRHRTPEPGLAYFKGMKKPVQVFSGIIPEGEKRVFSKIRYSEGIAKFIQDPETVDELEIGEVARVAKFCVKAKLQENALVAQCIGNAFQRRLASEGTTNSFFSKK